MLKVGFSGYGPRAANILREMVMDSGLLSDEVDEDGDRMPLFVPTAFFDIDKTKSKEMTFGAKYCDSFSKLLAEDLDALVVASPPQFHAEQVVAGLQQGLHVFSEVPMSLTIDGINEIIDACKSSPNARYMLGENYEYHDDVKYAAALAKDGKLGNLFYTEMEYMHDIRYRWYKPRPDSGIYGPGENDKPKTKPWYAEMNPLMYAHSIGPLLKIIGKAQGKRKPFISVNARGNAKVDKITGAMNFTVGLFETEDEVVGRAANAMAIIRKPARRCLNIYGSLGSFEAHEGDKFSTTRVFLASGPSFKEFNRGKMKEVPRKELVKVGGNDSALRDWADAIQKKKPATINEIHAAEQCAAGICAAQSAKTKKQVDIPSFN